MSKPLSISLAGACGPIHGPFDRELYRTCPSRAGEGGYEICELHPNHTHMFKVSVSETSITY